MNLFVKTTVAKKSRTPKSQQVTYFYVAILVVFAVAQLFTFDEFLVLVEKFNIPGGVSIAYLFATALVVGEVLALPFLLRLKISPLMRYFSMFLSCLVPALWLYVSIWLSASGSNISNIGYLGTVIDINPGWWTVFVGVALCFLAAWSAWGLWPGKRK